MNTEERLAALEARVKPRESYFDLVYPGSPTVAVQASYTASGAVSSPSLNVLLNYVRIA
jgi:hypothetical protein